MFGIAPKLRLCPGAIEGKLGRKAVSPCYRTPRTRQVGGTDNPIPHECMAADIVFPASASDAGQQAYATLVGGRAAPRPQLITHRVRQAKGLNRPVTFRGAEPHLSFTYR